MATIRQGHKDQDNSVLCRIARLSLRWRTRGGRGRPRLRKRRVRAGREVGNDRGRRRGRNSGCTWTICTVDLASRRATPTHTSLRARRGVCGSPRTYIRATCKRENVYALGSAYYSHSFARAGRSDTPARRRMHTQGWIAHNYPLSDTEIYVRIPRAHVTNERSAPKERDRVRKRERKGKRDLLNPKARRSMRLRPCR